MTDKPCTCHPLTDVIRAGFEGVDLEPCEVHDADVIDMRAHRPLNPTRAELASWVGMTVTDGDDAA